MLSGCSSTHEPFEFSFFFSFIPRVFNECTRMTVCSPLPWQSYNYVWLCACIYMRACVSFYLLVLAATIGGAGAARCMSFLLMLRYLNYARAVKVRHWRFEHVFADIFIETETETKNDTQKLLTVAKQSVNTSANRAPLYGSQINTAITKAGIRWIQQLPQLQIQIQIHWTTRWLWVIITKDGWAPKCLQCQCFHRWRLKYIRADGYHKFGVKQSLSTKCESAHLRHSPTRTVTNQVPVRCG